MGGSNMFFILQKEDKYRFNDIEFFIIQNLLNKNKYVHEYIIMSLDDFYDSVDIDENGLEKEKKLLTKNNFPKHFSNAIPIGTIQFVETYMKIFHNLEMENAIEIPPILRKDEFLKRKYSIVSIDEIPRKGNYFIKDATQLKSFSYNGELEYFLQDEMFQNDIDTNSKNILKLDCNHLYQVSENVNILSEYRVYIIRGKIEGIEFYNGNPCILPDVKLIEKANLLYSIQKDYPKSYSMDIMVTNRGTSIIEIHNFTSLGLYSTLWGDDLLYAYIDGIDYLIKYNTPQTKFSNFDTYDVSNIKTS
jgi:hypothetical protein